MGDAVADSLKKLDDASLWEVRRGIPIFDEHDDYTPDRLRLIAQNCNSRDQGGDLCPITIGHTLDRGPEPTVVGFARNFRVDAFGPKKKTGILSDFWFLKDHFEEARKYLRRSVELWPDELFFDPIALINRTPRRDLGMILHARSGKRVFRYAMEDWQNDSEPYAGEEQVGSGQGMSPEEERMYKMVERVLGAHPLMQLVQKHFGGGDVPAGSRPPVNNAASFPGAGSVSLPGGGLTRSPMSDSRDNDQVVRMQKELTDQSEKVVKMQKDLESHKEAYSKLQGNFEELKKSYDTERQSRMELEERLQLESRLADLRQMNSIEQGGEGLEFDVKEELEFCGKFQPEQYTKHKERMRKLYAKRQRPPVAPGFFVSGKAEVNGKKELTEDESKRVRDLALAEGIGYTQARTKLFP